MPSHTTKRRKRKVMLCVPDLFTWSRDTELLRHPAIRAITRRAGVGPALALVLAEHAGLLKEAGHG